MQNKTTLILVAIAIVLTGGVAVIEFGQRPQQQAVEADRQRLVRLEAEAITALSLTTEIDSLSLERGDSGWQLREPISSDVDVTAMETLLSNLTAVRPTSELSDIDNWADLGLEPPQNRLEITAESGTITLDLGEPTFDNQGRYARLNEGDTALVISADLANSLTPTLLTLRDKSLLGFEREAITAVSLAGGDSAWQIQRTEAGTWQAEASPETPLSPSTIDTFLNQLAFLQASAFVAEDQTGLAEFGLETPALTLTLERDSEPPLTLQLGDLLEITPPGQYVATSEIAGVATISIDQVATWPQTLADLRDRRLAEITPTLVGTIEIRSTNPDLNRSLSRKPLEEGTSEEFWLVSDQPDREVLLDALFQPLIEAEALRFETDIDTSEPSFSLILSPREGIDEPTLEFSFGEVVSETGGEVWATSSAQPDVLILPQDTLRTLLGIIDALQPEGNPEPAAAESPAEDATATDAAASPSPSE